MILAQGKRSAALGCAAKMPPFFPFRFGRSQRAKPEGKKGIGFEVAFSQGGGLHGLAPGYFLAAPPGRRIDEPES